MGLIVELEFGEGIRKVEIDGHKNARFVDDLPVKPDSWEAGFIKDYSEHGIEAVVHSRVGKLRDYWHDEWVETFVSAVLEQGPEAFDELMDGTDFAKRLYGFAYESDDYDYIQHALKFEAEEQVIGWMIRDLIEAIENKGYHYPRAGTIAEAMVGYVKPGEIVIQKCEFYGNDYNETRNIKFVEYTVLVRNHRIANWTIEIAYEIYDPVSFHGGVDHDDNFPGGNEHVESNTVEFLSYFDLSLPEAEDPGPPDHPEPVKDSELSDLGVLHEYDDQFDMFQDMADTWEVVRFANLSDVNHALRLSMEIYGNISYPTHVTLTPVRKLSQAEAEEVAADWDYMIAVAAMRGVPGPRDWELEWKSLEEDKG